MSNTFSKKISKKEKELIVKYLGSHVKENNNSSIEIFIKTKNYTISIFKTGTLLIQGSAYENVLKLLNEEPENQKSISLNKTLTNVIGSDESGNGDFFGGMAVCACYIEDNKIDMLKKLGVKDSKQLTDEDMKSMVDQLKANVKYELVYVDPEAYNKLFEKYKNINTIKTLLHHQAITKLAKKINTTTIVIDQYCNEKSFKKHLATIGEDLNYHLILETKAENKYLQVAAASIVARVKFINELDKLSEAIGINLPLGAVDSIVIPVLNKIKNRDDLNKFCKTHFRTFSKF